MNTSENRDARIKRLLYRSWYRGCKETDRVLGQFARENLRQFGDKEIDEFEIILNEQDWDVWNWMTCKEPLPEDLKDNSVMQKLLKYKFSESDY